MMDEEEYMYDEEPDFAQDFESQFQDELDMITEIDEPAKSKVPSNSKSKRKIKFKTPPEIPRSLPQKTGTASSSPDVAKSNPRIRKRMRLTKNKAAVTSLFTTEPVCSFLLDVPPRTNSMTCTLTDGRRFFVEAGTMSSTKNNHGDRANASKEPSSLLVQSLRELRAQIEQEDIQRAVQASSSQQTRNADQSSVTKREKGSLWVEKYAPKSFVDLLSNEKTNRGVLHWVKSWDNKVFGRAPSRLKDTRSGAGNNFFNKKGKAPSREVSKPFLMYREDVGMDEAKVLLLCGPPGMGKTTLAHIVARQAGYNPFEVNASDDRSAPKLMRAIDNATEMQSVFGKRKPNLVILDEIDGAAENNSAVAALARRLTQGKGVHRPIVCICNNRFAPVLRPLRDIALIKEFNDLGTVSLRTRLKFICEKENLRVSSGVISKLCVKTKNDVRSCINTLQFLYQRSDRGHRVTEAEVERMRSGEKDEKQNLFAAWENTLMPQRAGHMSTTSRSSVDFGDMETFMDGLRENLTSCTISDATLSRLSEALEHMSAARVWHEAAMQNQNWLLLRYAHVVSTFIRSNCRSRNRFKVKFPMEAIEAYRKTLRNTQLLQSFLMEAAARTLGPLPSLTSNFLSSLLDIIAAPGAGTDTSGPVPSDRAVALLTALGLRFIPMQTPNRFTAPSTAGVQLEPPLHLLAEFSTVDSRMRRHTPPSLATRIAMATAHARSVRQQGPEVTKTMRAKNPKAAVPENRSKGKGKRKPEANEAKTTFLSKACMRKRKKRAPRVLFKFQGGFTNAVKRPVYLANLL